jgi:hypothetical protein
MRKLICVMAGMAILAVPTSAEAVRDCGTINGDTAANIKAQHVSCKKARAVARRYVKPSLNPDKSPYGFTCVMKETRPDGGVTKCRKKGTEMRVSWDWYFVG